MPIRSLRQSLLHSLTGLTCPPLRLGSQQVGPGGDTVPPEQVLHSSRPVMSLSSSSSTTRRTSLFPRLQSFPGTRSPSSATHVSAFAPLMSLRVFCASCCRRTHPPRVWPPKSETKDRESGERKARNAEQKESMAEKLRLVRPGGEAIGNGHEL